MVDVVSLALAVVSIVGIIGAAALTGWFTLYSDQRRRRSETETLIAKYRDPLLLAATDLQSRFYNIVDQGVLSYFHASQGHREILILYTCFLIGQYFSWTYILRRQLQFLCFSTDQENKQLLDTLAEIVSIFATDGQYRYNHPFRLWRGQQAAIGEVMTVKEDGELMCLGYAEFVTRWEDQRFKKWFDPVDAGIAKLAVEASASDHRLRHLQHLLVDLIAVLDPKKLRSGDIRSGYCSNTAPECSCRRCKAERNPALSESSSEC